MPDCKYCDDTGIDERFASGVRACPRCDRGRIERIKYLHQLTSELRRRLENAQLEIQKLEGI